MKRVSHGDYITMCLPMVIDQPETVVADALKSAFEKSVWRKVMGDNFD